MLLWFYRSSGESKSRRMSPPQARRYTSIPWYVLSMILRRNSTSSTTIVIGEFSRICLRVTLTLAAPSTSQVVTWTFHNSWSNCWQQANSPLTSWLQHQKPTASSKGVSLKNTFLTFTASTKNHCWRLLQMVLSEWSSTNDVRQTVNLGGWTYHTKGIWITEPNRKAMVSVIGSSNFNMRSYERDTECQLYIYSECGSFNGRMEK